MQVSNPSIYLPTWAIANFYRFQHAYTHFRHAYTCFRHAGTHFQHLCPFSTCWHLFSTPTPVFNMLAPISNTYAFFRHASTYSQHRCTFSHPFSTPALIFDMLALFLTPHLVCAPLSLSFYPQTHVQAFVRVFY